jgi:serine beta-lactamase-like protein LACTB
MSTTRRRAQTALAIILAGAAVLAVAGVAVSVFVLWSAAKVPVHEDTALVPSRTDAAPAERYRGPADGARQRARTLIVEHNLPGLSVAVSIDGEIAWAEGFGWADARKEAPVTPRSRFRLGALSKPVTAVAAARLHDEGRLDLDAPIQRYVPDYPAKAWPVTTRQLLGDVAGVHRIRGDDNDAMPTEHCDSIDDAVALLAGDPLQFEPGTQHRYSIWGWVLASAVVEGAAGQPFDRVMDRQVFDPLGMTRTVAAETADLADVAHDSESRPDYSCVAGGGAFLSTPTDLVRLGSAMLKPGFLRAATIADFQRPTRLASGASTTYAMGWTVGSHTLAGAPVRMVSHRGSPAGGAASLLTFPDLGLAVAVAANAGDSRTVNAFALQVAEAFAGLGAGSRSTDRARPPSNGAEVP